MHSLHSGTVANYRRFLKKTASCQHHVPTIHRKYTLEYQTQITVLRIPFPFYLQPPVRHHHSLSHTSNSSDSSIRIQAFLRSPSWSRQKRRTPSHCFVSTPRRLSSSRHILIHECDEYVPASVLVAALRATKHPTSATGTSPGAIISRPQTPHHHVVSAS